MEQLVLAKRINKLHQRYLKSIEPILRASLVSIVSVSRLAEQLGATARVSYDQENKDHEERLLYLWKLLRPDTRLSNRITNEWGEIGFQGTNPATDFRGMGMLGLENLIGFTERWPMHAHRILSESVAHRNWFSFAITSLNLTFDLYKLVNERRINCVLYRYGATMDTFQRLHALMFIRFNAAWAEADPPNMMSFSSIHTPFINKFVADAQADRINLSILNK